MKLKVQKKNIKKWQNIFSLLQNNIALSVFYCICYLFIIEYYIFYVFL